MIRDMDLVRSILLSMDSSSLARHSYGDFMEMVDISKDELTAHLLLMKEAGLLATYCDWYGTLSNGNLVMTWSGHDFLDSIRDDELWTKTKQAVGAAKGFTFELLKDIARGFLKTKIEKHTGVEL